MATYLQPDNTIMIWNTLPIYQYYIINHNVNKISMPSKRTKKLKGITVHNTDWINVNPATTPAEQYTRACVNGNLNSVRVTYYVDDKCIWQNLPDDWQSWHAADGNGDGNTATISIECIMKSTNDPTSLKSRENCAKLVAYLLKKYDLTTNDVYTHTYWLHVRDKDSISKTSTKDEICTARHSYKVCPLFIIPQWNEFLAQVNGYLKELGGKVETVVSTPKPTTTNNALPYTVRILDDALNIRKQPGTQNPVVAVIKNKGVYTIVDEKKVNGSTWGLLKGYASGRNGWINVSPAYVKKV